MIWMWLRSSRDQWVSTFGRVTRDRLDYVLMTCVCHQPQMVWIPQPLKMEFKPIRTSENFVVEKQLNWGIRLALKSELDPVASQVCVVRSLLRQIWFSVKRLAEDIETNHALLKNIQLTNEDLLKLIQQYPSIASSFICYALKSEDFQRWVLSPTIRFWLE